MLERGYESVKSRVNDGRESVRSRGNALALKMGRCPPCICKFYHVLSNYEDVRYRYNRLRCEELDSY
jgi:hypothetical protein